MLSTRFWPITARPTSPTSALLAAGVASDMPGHYTRWNTARAERFCFWMTKHLPLAGFVCFAVSMWGSAYAEDKKYSMADLKALVEQKSYREVIQHLAIRLLLDE